MNIVDTGIETLRERFRLLTTRQRQENGFAWSDGYRAAMQDAATELEHCLRGMSHEMALQALADPRGFAEFLQREIAARKAKEQSGGTDG